MSTRKLLSWILIGSAAALAIGSGVLVTRRLLAEARSNPSRIIDGCDKMLSSLERRIEGRGRRPSTAGVGS